MKNILEAFLEQLKIPYTKHFAEQLYEEHPYRNNMLGLRQMLGIYGIQTQGVKTEDLSSLPMPCILHLSGRFVIGIESTTEQITYLWHQKKIRSKIADFQKQWTGNALIPEDISMAAEPEYIQHRKEQFLHLAEWFAVICAILFYGIFNFTLHQNYLQPLSYIFIGIDLLGIGICSLLLQKQMFNSSQIGDKICTMFHQTDCNHILYSEGAKIGPYSWSEIGMGYFFSHLLFTVSHPDAIPMLSIIGWGAMVYGIWSIYYQATVVHQWCILCLYVQALLWINGIVTALYLGYHHIPFEIQAILIHFLLFGAIVVTTIFVIHKITEVITEKQDKIQATFQYRALKSNKDVFTTILRQSQFIQTDDTDSAILLGNPQAKMRITILTNPYCNPCAKMHKKVERLLDESPQNICIQYIFSSFNEDLEDSNRFLIAAYQQLGPEYARDIYSQWYEKGKYNSQAFMKNWPTIIFHAPAVEKELTHHQNWKNRTQITATPTLLVNGYILPPEYSIEDLLPLAVRNLEFIPLPNSD